MTLPSVNAQLRAMTGTAQPKPRKADRVREQKHKQRQAIGAKPRAEARREESFYPTLERMFNIHRLDFWHCYNPGYEKEAGFPDFLICGAGWLAFMEVKAVSINTGRWGKLTTEQKRWRKSIEDGGGEYVDFTLPNEWADIDEWLYQHTGIEARGTWRTA